MYLRNVIHLQFLLQRDHNPNYFCCPIRTCFEQWQNPAFAEQMNSFMKGNGSSPLIFMMQQGPSAHCRCGAQAQDWTKGNEPKKCKVQLSASINICNFVFC